MLREIVIFVIVALDVMSVVRGEDVDCSKRPEFVDPRTCCAMPDLVSEELKDQCQQQYKPSGDGPQHKLHMRTCYKECLLNATELIVNDELDEAKLTEVMGDASDMQPIVVESFTTCLAKIKEMEALRKESGRGPPLPPPGVDACHRGYLLVCVHFESFKNCPSDRWNDSQECNDVRNHMIHCKPRGPPHGHHGPHGKHSQETDTEAK